MRNRRHSRATQEPLGYATGERRQRRLLPWPLTVGLMLGTVALIALIFLVIDLMLRALAD